MVVPMPFFPLGDNDGNIPGMLDEMYRMGLRWLKLLDVDGSSYNACRMVLAHGMMPVVRLYRERPYPGRLSDKHRAVLPQLVALGVRYFERGNEPNLVGEWQEGQWPAAWTDAVFDSLVADWLADAQYIVDCGGYPAIDACSPGGNVDDIVFLTSWLRALTRAKPSTALLTRTWLAVHNAGLNHPLDYPDDATNQAEHPGQTIHTHYYADGSPTGASNCIRKWAAVHQLALDVASLDLPVLCTEGGYWPGNAADSRYPALTEETASALQAAALRGMATAPAWLIAQMPWLWFNRLGANRHEGFERDAWKRSPGFGNCPAGAPAERPIVAMLKSHPCQGRSAVVPETPTTPTPTETAISASELETCRTALSVLPATMKACDARGYVFRSEVNRPAESHVYAIAYDPAAKCYKGLKLERQTWSVVAEAAL